MHPARDGSPSRRPNRLASSTSPYLLQHAHNPVDWYPWGDEAFAEAKRRDVPVLLSIGYSTCYWCHVMERESFENDSIAALMNEHFVCIKIDREERPDLDDIYMTATQILTSHGGWPMTVFLDPNTRKPFWCGTYFPPESRPNMGVPSLPHVIQNISAAWVSQRAEVVAQAEQIGEIVRERLASTATAPDSLSAAKVATEAVSGLLRMFDRNHGGFGGAPKFPQPVFLELLLDARERAGSEQTRAAIDEAVRVTLDKMLIGGVYDQVGGGFHRYSVDATWTVPHFEKMLYDNAQLLSVYARAARVYNDPEYARIVRETAAYLHREMRTGGGFASAQDAEVDAREGLNYVWTPEQVRAALPAEDVAFALKVFSLDSGANFRDPHHPAEPATNVLRLRDRPEVLASELGWSVEAFHATRAKVCAVLLAARDLRKQPHRDDKALAAWNGLAIHGLATAAESLGDASLLNDAVAAAQFVLGVLRGPTGLCRSWRAGVRGGYAFLEDYGACILGLSTLARALKVLSPEQPSLAGEFHTAAMALADEASRMFRSTDGKWFDTAPDQTDSFVRTRSLHDGAVPCGSSMLLLGFLELARSGNADAMVHAESLLRSMAGAIDEMPLGLAWSTRAVLQLASDPAFASSPVRALVTASATSTPDATQASSPVEVFSSTERVAISSGTPGVLRLALRIAPGYHVLAADPWVDDPKSAMRGLIPLRVHVRGGTGIEVYADYPAGEPYTAAAAVLGTPRVYSGEVDFEVALEQTGEISGRPLLAVTFQACSDRECLAPRTVELDIAIDQASTP
ncbi:MAG: thioredoxin domain-containing protein [Phycisphaerales bacterium]|nr:thioredoxin domain-containing protein [Phycisphaerales bacterium]